MNSASDSAGTGLRAIQEIQVRFLLAASAAGIIALQLDEPDLREVLRRDEDALREAIDESALAGAAYTYQAFSDEEVLAYTEALEHPDMRSVYDLMNAVQYEIMANRFEALAIAMAGLQPSEEL
jgi:methionine synthase II (cobalamin-independent)